MRLSWPSNVGTQLRREAKAMMSELTALVVVRQDALTLRCIYRRRVCESAGIRRAVKKLYRRRFAGS